MIFERGLGILQRGFERIRNRMRLQIELEHAGIELRHLSCLAHQAVQAIGLFVDDGQQVRSGLVVERRA